MSNSNSFLTLFFRQCSVPCGAGLQSRSATCVAGDGSGNALANERCVSKDRPSLSQSCNMEPCPPVSCRDVQRKQRKTTDGLYTLKIANRLISVRIQYSNLKRGSYDFAVDLLLRDAYLRPRRIRSSFVSPAKFWQYVRLQVREDFAHENSFC